MITRFSASLSVSILSLVAVAACTETPGADQISAIPEQVQVQAHANCQAEQGLVNGAAVQILELGNGKIIASTLNGNGVTLAQARAVNQCAQRKLLNGQTTAIAPVQSRPVVVAEKPVVAHQNTYDGLAGCVQGGGVIQGGVRMCPGY